jgi:integrase
MIERYYSEAKAASATLSLHHAILQRALKKALRDRLISRNVAVEVDAKPRASRDHSREARLHCWTAEEARRFLDAAAKAGTQQAAFYALALDAGMRRGELGGLAWADVDLDGAKVTVSRQLLDRGKTERGRRGENDESTRQPTFGPTKTGRVRSIDIDAGTVALLAKHRRSQAELKMANRNTYRDHGLVFAKEWADVRGHFDSLGRPLQLNNLGQREFSRLIKTAGVKPIKLHGLRHTCATLLLAAGEPVHVVSERLGHASAMMTINVYSHVVGNMQKIAASTVGRVLYSGS